LSIINYFSRNQIIMLCGEDIHNNCDYEFFSNQGINVFVREL